MKPKTEEEASSEIYRFQVAAKDVCDLARGGNKYALRKLVRVAVQLAQCMDELMLTDTPARKLALKCWRPIFAGLPFLPVLKHRHGGDMKQIQKRFDLLQVGSELNYAKEGAKFDPFTPINAYVRECLIHLHEVREHIDSRLKCGWKPGRAKTPEQALAHCTKIKWFNEVGEYQGDLGWLSAAEIPIHLAAYKLPPLAKTSGVWGVKKSLAEQWARDVLVPLIQLREPSLEIFARRMGWKVRPGKVESDVRNKVAQSLETLADKFH